MSGGQRTVLIVAIGVLIVGAIGALMARPSGGCTRDVPLDIRAAIGGKARTFGPGQSTRPGTYIGYDDGSRWFVSTLLDVTVAGAGAGNFSRQDFVVRGTKGQRRVTSIRPAAAFEVAPEPDLKVAERGSTKLATCR